MQYFQIKSKTNFRGVIYLEIIRLGVIGKLLVSQHIDIYPIIMFFYYYKDLLKYFLYNNIIIIFFTIYDRANI